MRRAEEMSRTCARAFSQEGSGRGDDSAELAKMMMSEKNCRLCQRMQQSNKKKADASDALRQKRRLDAHRLEGRFRHALGLVERGEVGQFSTSVCQLVHCPADPGSE